MAIMHFFPENVLWPLDGGDYMGVNHIKENMKNSHSDCADIYHIRRVKFLHIDA